MYRVMYVSTAVKDFTNEELEYLLEQSQTNNLKRGITGLLIVKGRTFVQCIEGDKDDVLYIYEKILRDERHKDILELVEESCEKRYFPKWSMGYKNIDYLTSVESSKLKAISSQDFEDIEKEDIPDILRNFIED